MTLNERANLIADELARRAGELAVEVHTVAKARVIDAGVNVIGGIEAGLLVSRICLADLGVASVHPGAVGDVPCPVIAVNVHHPVVACMASQYAGWQVSVDKFFAMGSGPMRAVYGKEKLYDDIGFRERVPVAVGVLETSNLPSDSVVGMIADKCKVRPNKVTLVVARTASIAGSVQVVARSVETALHKLHELKFKLARIQSAYGFAPLPPVAKDDLAGIGRTNDAVLYGGRVVLYVKGDDESLIEVGKQLPSSSSRDYGQPFAQVFKRYDHDFYKIDPMLFAPAQVIFQNNETGRTHVFGRVNEQVLAESFYR
ncbi:MAG: methenyltetrahydromethanopterin cyclohydrolase [Phycisphaera sp.]|nr:methenyltetrahydromethanopterin cyclohydrolase [Phycisphaera sp.]